MVVWEVIYTPIPYECNNKIDIDGKFLMFIYIHIPSC